MNRLISSEITCMVPCNKLLFSYFIVPKLLLLFCDCISSLKKQNYFSIWQPNLHTFGATFFYLQLRNPSFIFMCIRLFLRRSPCKGHAWDSIHPQWTAAAESSTVQI
jgi:hypothetical protein